MNMKRCHWAGNDKIYIDYHDKEWGVPTHDDKILFEFLILEGAQAGLSWITILKRRAGYKEAYDDFNVNKIAKYDAEKVSELLNNTGIVRNKLKVASSIENAKVFLEIQKEFTSFDNYIWEFVGNKPMQNNFNNANNVPASTEISDTISKDLKKRGMSFVGSTIIYAYMQSMGLVNDHTTDCFKHALE